MPQPNTHYFEVELLVSGVSAKQTVFKMATWTPGSYLIREYAKNVETVLAKDSKGKAVAIAKTAKNTWVANSGGVSVFTVSYRVYANELSVRNCFLDEEHGYLNGASVFFYVKGEEQQKSTLKVNLPADWKHVVTALKPIGTAGNEFEIQNLDELIDSPIQCGNPLVVAFEAGGVKHRVAFQGPGNVNPEKIKTDFAKIVEAEKAVFQHHPCKEYTFIVHNMLNGSGGLEHSNSTTLQTSPTTYDNESSYTGFLGLVAHEYFHLWNVKRLRPKPLGPFDYENENYTSMLWIAEGFTAYYDDFFLFRAGLTKKEKFLDAVGSNISRVESVPGMYVQTLAEASLDAWIKYYRPNENSGNSQSDYYTKGAALATMLDLMLIKESQGAQNLDMMLKAMYDEFYLKKNVGFTEQDVENELVKRLGQKGKNFLTKYVYGLERPDWAGTFADFGIKIVDRNDATQPVSIGLRLAGSNGKFTVAGLPKNGPAYLSGIYIGDEILSIGDRRLESPDLNPYFTGLKPGEKVQILYSRGGEMKSTTIELIREPGKSYRLDWVETATPEQDMLRKKWLRMM